MVTGFANLRRSGSRLQWGTALCYVADVTTGQSRLCRAMVAHHVPVGATVLGVAGEGGDRLLLAGVGRTVVPPDACDKDKVGWVERSEPHRKNQKTVGGARCARPTLQLDAPEKLQAMQITIDGEPHEVAETIPSPGSSSSSTWQASPWRSRSTASWFRGSTMPATAWPTVTALRSSRWSEEDNRIMGEQLRIGKHAFSSRLLVGTGKYSSYAQMREWRSRPASASRWPSAASG